MISQTGELSTDIQVFFQNMFKLSVRLNVGWMIEVWNSKTIDSDFVYDQFWLVGFNYWTILLDTNLPQ